MRHHVGMPRLLGRGAVRQDPRGGVASSACSNPMAVVLLGGILALAVALRILFLGRPSFWWDEIRSVQRAPELLNTVLHREANMSFYYALLRLWLHLGRSEFIVRSLSVMFSVATVPVLYALGARLFGVRAGLVAGLLAALNTYHIRYAQEARSYSLVVFLVTIASYEFVVGIEQPSLRSWVTYIIASILAVYSHVFGALVLVAHWVSLVFVRPREIPWRSLLTSTIIIGLLLLPLGFLVVTGDVGDHTWIPKPTLDALPRVLAWLTGAGGGSLPASLKKPLALPELERRLLLLAYGALITAALAHAVKLWRLRRGSLEAWHYGFIVSWLFVPLLLAFGVSLVKPIFVPYYFIICLPPLVLLAAIGISRIDRQWVFLGILAMVVSLASHEVFSYYTYGTREDWRGVTRYILSHAQRGDTVIFYQPAGREMFEFYRDRLAASTEQIPLVISDSEHPPDGTRRVWLVLAHDEVIVRTPAGTLGYDVQGRAIQASIAQNHLLTREEVFAGQFGDTIRVLLYIIP